MPMSEEQQVGMQQFGEGIPTTLQMLLGINA